MSKDLPRTADARGNSSTASELYRFGPIAVDAARHRVTRDDHSLALPPKTYELLLILLRSGGRALSRQELISALWPDTFVEEANLTFQVSTLRKTLGEHADEWIETVPRVGYRFTPTVKTQAAPLVDLEQESPAVGLAAVAPRPVVPFDASREPLEQRPRAPLLPVLTVLAAVALSAIGWRLVQRTDTTDHEPRFGSTATPLTAFIGDETIPSLSPDGSQVAFMWDGPGQDNWDIYVKSIGGGEPIRLTTDSLLEGAAAWSPDGRRLAFLSQVVTSQAQDVIVMPALGGTARRVGTVSVIPPSVEYQMSVRHVSWSPDGRWIAVGAVIDGAPGIWVLEADGPERRRLTPDGMRGRGPVFSTDGRYLAFIRPTGARQSALMVQPIGTDMQPSGAPVELIPSQSRQVISVAWAPGNRALVYSSGAGLGSSRLWRVPFDAPRGVAAGEPEAMLAGEQATGLDIASSGRMVYVRQFRDSGLWRLDLQHPEKGFESTNLPASTFDEHTPAYSPDGTRLAFASTRTGTEEIWIADIDGAHARQMTTMGAALCGSPRWSPDGRTIAFEAVVDGQSDIYSVDVQTAEVRRITTGAGDRSNPRWSRDGQSIYFGSFRPPGPPEVRRMPATGGPSTTMAEGAVGEPTSDGRWLIVSRLVNQRSTLWRVALPNGEPTLLTDPQHRGFVVGRRTVYVLTTRPPGIAVSLGTVVVEAVDIESGQRRTLATLDKRTWWGMAVSPDERWLLISAINAQGTDLMVVEPAR